MKVSERPTNSCSWLLQKTLELDMGKAGAAVMTGMIVSFLLIIMSISYPSLVFSGRLEQYSGMGIQMAFGSAVVFCIVLSLLSTCPGVVGVAQGETAAVLGLATASIAEGVAPGRPDLILPTVMATIMCSSLLVAILFTLLGSFRLGNLIRFVPLPVMGGFLAGIGWLLSSGAVKTMTGLPLTLGSIAALVQPLMLLKWLPGLLSAVVLLVLQRNRPGVFNLFLVAVATVALFWLAAWLNGLSPSRLTADGWLLATGSNQSNWAPFEYVRALDSIDWLAVFHQLPQLGTLLIIALICVLMAASSLELLSGRDIDLNRELIAAGLGNLLCAAMGSLPGYHSLGASTLSQKMGTPLRSVGLVSGAICAVAYSLGVSFLVMLPKILVGTIVLYIAITLLIEWLYDTWFRLSRGDYFLLLLVFGCVSFVGLIKGVVIGVIAGLASFAFDYGRISIARQVGSSVNMRSNVVYSEAKNAILREHGKESYIVRLQGFIFFGTANRLLSRIRARMLEPGTVLHCVVLDFKNVFGLDSSAALSFLKLRQYAEHSGFMIGLSGLADQIDTSLRHAGIYEGNAPCVHKFDDLDHALEYCEKTIICAHMLSTDEDSYPVEELLKPAFPDPEKAKAFAAYLQSISLSKGDYLFRQGDDSDDLFFIESGWVAVVLEKPPATPLRINSMGPGTVVGEIGFFLERPRVDSAIAETEARVHQLTRKSLEIIRSESPELFIAFEGFIARMLAKRLNDMYRSIQIDQVTGTGPKYLH
jgi:SulP family sulfate permease